MGFFDRLFSKKTKVVDIGVPAKAQVPADPTADSLEEKVEQLEENVAAVKKTTKSKAPKAAAAKAPRKPRATKPSSKSK